jgi:hypothetical protein
MCCVNGAGGIVWITDNSGRFALKPYKETPVKGKKTRVPRTSIKGAKRNPILVCSVMTIVALIGIVLGLLFKNPLVMILLLIPAGVYEVIRTAGVSTKAASVLLLVVLVLETILIVFRTSINLADFLGMSETYIGGYKVILGDIRVVGAAVMAVLSVVLLLRTEGPYTKWLAVVIIVTSLAIIYTVAPADFQRTIQSAVEQVR